MKIGAPSGAAMFVKLRRLHVFSSKLFFGSTAGSATRDLRRWKQLRLRRHSRPQLLQVSRLVVSGYHIVVYQPALLPAHPPHLVHQLQAGGGGPGDGEPQQDGGQAVLHGDTAHYASQVGYTCVEQYLLICAAVETTSGLER